MCSNTTSTETIQRFQKVRMTLLTRCLLSSILTPATPLSKRLLRPHRPKHLRVKHPMNPWRLLPPRTRAILALFFHSYFVLFFLKGHSPATIICVLSGRYWRFNEIYLFCLLRLLFIFISHPDAIGALIISSLLRLLIHFIAQPLSLILG